MDGLTVGRVVHYVLSKGDAEIINERNKVGNEISLGEKVPGLQYHGGNSVAEGQHCAMVIVQVWNPEGTVNGKVLLDGLSDYWATSRRYSDAKEPSSWHWLEKV